MRMMIKKLLRSHRYPPDGMDDAVETVMTQCELWTDNSDMEGNMESNNKINYSLNLDTHLMVADESSNYGNKRQEKKWTQPKEIFMLF